MSYYAGIDIGSIAAKALVINDAEKILAKAVMPTGIGGSKIAAKVLHEALNQIGIRQENVEFMVATGYGRISVPFECKKVTEITCHGRGVHYLFPEARLIVDIGGQDSKVIKLGNSGQVIDFAMNDKCAAGTGRFLEVIAQAMQVALTDLGDLSATSQNRVEISSTCTVFAESEVVSLVARGTQREDIVAGVHRSIVNRVYSLLKGKMDAHFSGVIIMTGGVAKNRGVVSAMREKSGCKVLVPDEPQFTGALGAAMIARESAIKHA